MAAKLSRDDYRKQKELEEARKAGTAPPEKDEDGKDINPHIPQYIREAPWYMSSNKPSLKHQRMTNEKKYDTINDWYARGVRAGPAATKYRKGACENCGAMTHKTKDCCERPRKIGARWTGKDIMPDEVIKEVHLDFEGKRDRWNGFQPDSMFKEQLELYERAEQERRQKKKMEELNKFMTEPDEAQNRFPTGKEKKDKKKKESLVDTDSEDSDSDVDADAIKSDFLTEESSDQVAIKKDPKTRTNIRNLRIREDIAKYLRNLDSESALYDPKSRSMRDNPNPHLPPEEQLYSGDNFVRATGDVPKFWQMQLFSYTAYEKGVDVHMQAVPSQAELVYKKTSQDSMKTREQLQKELLAKYGGRQYLDAPPETALLSQSEHYVEYRPDGTVARGKEKGIPKSKYEEDVLINNHKQIWGSYWEAGQWGYACCRSLVKNSYCTGQAGIAASQQSNEEMLKRQELFERKSQEDAQETTKSGKSSEKKRSHEAFDPWGSQVSKKELEEYHRKKARAEDPMAAFLTKK